MVAADRREGGYSPVGMYESAAKRRVSVRVTMNTSEMGKRK